ncbi:hypothetical protein E0485_13570 [Paenibacillus albiflavus]|uniref:Aminoglycoside phosphotransferase domain-containing protein n=1 Tax=Paenibacillus albiflavus TaxID=2545760 RepID=A0A4R4EEY5_9BACL|nr:phosphotransferase [Paenibacillus albiflavus]TCZ76615.1 hypothetical protein E0485_13570 [Paenibacillus albiflavus]
MMKLKYLFNNENLAEMLLKNWKYDPESIELFQYYRISSNAIYPFRFEGKTHLLRFAPVVEKNKDNVLAEFEFIAYLRDNGCGVLETVQSCAGEELVEVQTPWGAYYASVFKRVSGVQLDRTDLNDTIIYRYGQALGKLHRLSSQYTPVGAPRWSYGDVLDWIEDQLRDLPNETKTRMEVAILRDYFDKLPKSPSHYGLIHYDFEFDNVFYDQESGGCNIIDFDDAMYHWYVMDLVQVFECLHEFIPSEVYNEKMQCFIDGYRTEYDLPSDWETIVPACKRFAGLYGYARTLRSIADSWDHEPEWLMNLRARLAERMEEEAAGFGTDLNIL